MDIDNLFEVTAARIEKEKKDAADALLRKKEEEFKRCQNIFGILLADAGANLRHMITSSAKFRFLIARERDPIILGYHGTLSGYLPVALVFQHEEARLKWWLGRHDVDKENLLWLFGNNLLNPFLPLLQTLSQPDTALEFFLRKQFVTDGSYCPDPANYISSDGGYE